MAYRPTDFPLAAKAHLDTYRCGVFCADGLFIVDVDAMSDNEAQRIAVHAYQFSKYSLLPVSKIEVAKIS